MRLLRLDLAEKALLRATGLETSLAIQIAECRNELCVLETRAHPAFLFISTLNYILSFHFPSIATSFYTFSMCLSARSKRVYRRRASCHWQCENNCIKNTHDVHILKKKTMRALCNFALERTTTDDKQRRRRHSGNWDRIPSISLAYE